MRFKLLFLCVGLVGSHIGMADTKKKESKGEMSKSEDKDEYMAPYGMAGCGLGSLIIKDNKLGPQVGVSIINYLIGFQTSGITTGTSNCVEHSPAYTKMEQEVFIGANLASLSKESAQGQGEHLHALAEVFGCGDKDAFAALNQRRYSDIYSKLEAGVVLDNYVREIGSAQLNCARVKS